MPVTIRKRSALLEPIALKNTTPSTTLEITIPEVRSEVLPTVETISPPKVETGIPKGRRYLKEKKSFDGTKPQHSYHKPQKTLEQILPRVYNVNSSKSDDDANSEYYSPYKCIDCKDTKKIMVYDTCEFCDGTGCRKCNNTGEFKSFIPCQLCNNKVRQHG